MNFELSRYQGQEIAEVVQTLAELRIEVFREWPYLYEGSLEYEKEYLKNYINSSGSLVIVARLEEEIIGISTAMPMIDKSKEYQKPFIEQNYSVEKIFYFGESIVKPQFRGNGLGKYFFEMRENHALNDLADLKQTVFCAVERARGHASCPVAYKPLDSFWLRQGYSKEPALKTTLSWQDVGAEVQTPKKMQFWLKQFP